MGVQLSDAINTIVNQFVRNAVTHGIENPAERKLRGKSEAGRISVYVSDQGDGNGCDKQANDVGERDNHAPRYP